MKTFKKITSVILSLGMLTAPLVGATGCDDGPKEGVLSIAAFEGGNGNQYANALAQAFKAYHPDIEVDVLCDPTVPEGAATALESNSSDVDVYMINGVNMGALCENSNGALANLNDVYSSKPETDSEQGDKTIAQLIDPYLLPLMQYGGDRTEYVNNYYAIPTGSNPLGLVLNKTVLDNVLGAGNWSVPKTTNQLIALCDAVQLADVKVNIAGEEQLVYPFIYAGNAVEYWRYMWYCWQAQYDGAATFKQSQSCKINGEYNKEAYFTDGKAKAMEVMQTILDPANDYCHTSSRSGKHTQSQKYFMQGRAAMMCTGNWIENETSTGYKPELIMVKAPMLSDMADLIGLTGTAQEKDAALADLVDKIDNGATSDSRLSDTNFQKLAQARSIVFTLANSEIAVIPSTSINLELAKEFLRFMYSQEGFEIFLRTTNGARLPVPSYTLPTDFVNDMSLFGTSVYNIAQSSPTYIYSSSADPIRFRAGLTEFLANDKPEMAMSKPKNAVTAAEYLADERVLLDNQWAGLMSQVQ